ncbi:MAG: hypothetical protein JXK07_05770 [Spirochaetes bacterium]|nr:hypothetical protein [Spirochaetota bacterium]MBN2771731.1 hypothetical protein [Spirochaetota bacterium]
MNIMEEKTPKGYILKINKLKMNFLVFDRLGSTVYADSEQIESIHKIPHIVFYGSGFILKRRIVGEYNLLKVSRGKILIPYYVKNNKDLHYHLLPTNEQSDMIPVKVIKIEKPLEFIRYIESGNKPDYVIIEENIDETDQAVLYDRYAQGNFIRIDIERADLVSRENYENVDEDYHSVNLNMMSGNPVFLSIIHIQNFNLSGVRQLLLDFDLDEEQISYMIAYMTIQINNSSFPSPEKNMEKMLQLRKEMNFYQFLLIHDKENCSELIDEITDSTTLNSFLTLLAKVSSMTDDESNLDMVDIQNMLYEKKEALAGV